MQIFLIKLCYQLKKENECQRKSSYARMSQNDFYSFLLTGIPTKRKIVCLSWYYAKYYS